MLTKNNKETWLAFSIAMAVVISSFTGCENSKPKDTEENTTKIVQVSKIEGTTITAKTGKLSAGEQGSTPPKGAPSGAGDDKQGGTPPDDKQQNGTAPAGNPSEGEAPPEKPSDGNGNTAEGSGKPSEVVSYHR